MHLSGRNGCLLFGLTVSRGEGGGDGHALVTVLLTQDLDRVHGASLQASQLVFHRVSSQHHSHGHIRNCGKKDGSSDSAHPFMCFIYFVAPLTLGGLIADDEAVHFAQTGCPLQQSFGVCHVDDSQMCWRGGYCREEEH